MLLRRGFTLMEVIVVILIIGVCVALISPNFTGSTEQSYAQIVKNNLMSVYGAQQTYLNNNGTYCFGAAPNCDSLADINTALSLSIQDDGTYTYVCSLVALVPTCKATRNNPPTLSPVLTLTLNQPINSNNVNPICTNAANPSWCP